MVFNTLGISQIFISPVTGIFSLCLSHKNNIIFNHLHEIICTSLDIIEKRGRVRLFQKMMYHAGKFEWSAMLDFYAAVITVVESGKKTWDDSMNFQDIEHIVLGMQPLARQVEMEKSSKMGGNVADSKPSQK